MNNDCVEKPPVFEKTLKIGEAKHKGSFIKIDPRAILARSFSHVMRREGFSTQSVIHSLTPKSDPEDRHGGAYVAVEAGTGRPDPVARAARAFAQRAS